jgi:hypothetical protein
MPADAVSLAARTDQTKLCRTCAARFGGIECPGCGESACLDLSRRKERRLAIAWAAERFAGRRVHPFLAPEESPLHAPSAAPLAIAVALTVLALDHGLWLAAIGSALLAVVLVTRRLRGREFPRLSGGARSSSLSSLHAIGVLPPALPPASEERVARRGSARSDAPLEAPLSGEPCIAFRLVGRAGDCLVDDAAAAPFVLAPRDGPPVTVLSSACVLDVPVHRVAAAPGALARVRRFLAERGVNGRADPIELAEGVIRNGDEVAIEGVLESVASGAGYRGSAHAEFVVGRTDAPVVVRRS